MKYFSKGIYFLLAFTIFITSGCDSSTRDLDSLTKKTSPINNPNPTQSEEDNQTQVIQPPNTGGEISDENTTTADIKIDAKNAYRVSLKFSDNYNQKGYFTKAEIGQIHFDITNIYTGSPADVSIIENIRLEAEDRNDSEGKYFNFITYSGEQGPVYTIPKDHIKASDDVALKVGNLSGTTNLIFKATIQLDANQTSSVFTVKVPLVIEKNKSSSMAIVPIGSRYENGLFIDKFLIHVVDSYGNKAEDGTQISAGVINNVKLYSNAYNGGFGTNGANLPDTILPQNRFGKVATIDYDNGVNLNQTVGYYQLKNDKGNLSRTNKTFNLPANSIDISKDTITQLDTLILLANKNQHKPQNLGGWDIKSIDSDHEISLLSMDMGEDANGLSYAIGDEYRYDECRQTLMNAAASTFETTEVKDGIAYAELRYVPDMVGKTVFIYANSQLENKHIGISRKVTLTGTGLQTQTMSCTNENGTKPDCTISYRMVQKDSGELARNVYIAQPTMAGDPVYKAATASRTDCSGWTTVTIYGIDVNKTASVKFGDYISDELILNQK